MINFRISLLAFLLIPCVAMSDTGDVLSAKSKLFSCMSSAGNNSDMRDMCIKKFHQERSLIQRDVSSEIYTNKTMSEAVKRKRLEQSSKYNMAEE